jgi:hypothetical protein
MSVTTKRDGKARPWASEGDEEALSKSDKHPTDKPPKKRILEDGCYLIRYEPVDPSHDTLFFEGTARVLRVGSDGQRARDSEDAIIKAGADLYSRPACCADLVEPDHKEMKKKDPRISGWTNPEDKDDGKVPIFKRSLYRYYLQVTDVLEGVPKKENEEDEENVTVRFLVYEFRQDTAWPNPGKVSVCLEKVSAIGNHNQYLAGNVVDEDSGQTLGALTMCRVSKYLRRATVFIHAAKGVNVLPGDRSQGQLDGDPTAVNSFIASTDHRNFKWQKAFDEAGWKLNLEDGTQLEPPEDLPPATSPPVEELTGPVEQKTDSPKWSTGALRQALHKIRVDRIVKSAGSRMAENQLTKLEQMSLAEIKLQFPEIAKAEDPLDKEWQYDLLCVQGLEEFDRGVMFDTYSSDSEELPREGAAIAAEWVFGSDADRLNKEKTPNDVKAKAAQKVNVEQIRIRWGDAAGNEAAHIRPAKLQNVPRAYFRVAVHEIGHAMGLDHNYQDDGFMNTTDTIAQEELTAENDALMASLLARQQSQLQAPITTQTLTGAARTTAMKLVGLPPAQAMKLVGLPAAMASAKIANDKLAGTDPFPGCIEWHFHPDDLNRLRFGPDVTIRPGTTSDSFGPLFGDQPPARADGLDLEASALLETVPFGAPVRVRLRIKNTSNQQQKVPSSLSLKMGVVDGRVVGPDGNERTFWPLKKWEDSDASAVLVPGETMTYAMTLLRGAQKSLFPMPGNHRIRANVAWDVEGNSVYLDSEATVTVTPPVDDNHRAAALKIISTPDTLLSLAIGGDQFKEGNKAIEAAMGNPVLKPHFAIVQARLFLVGTDPTDPVKGCNLMEDSMVVSFDEIDSASKLLEKRYPYPKQNVEVAEFKAAVAVLTQKIDQFVADGSIEDSRAEFVKMRLKKICP